MKELTFDERMEEALRQLREAFNECREAHKEYMKVGEELLGDMQVNQTKMENIAHQINELEGE